MILSLKLKQGGFKMKKSYRTKEEVVQREILIELGYAVYSYYVEKEGMALYSKPTETLDSINVRKVEFKKHIFKPNEIIITCYRPGLLMGKARCLINHVKKEFSESRNKKLSTAVISIKEDKVYDSLFSFQIVG
jgi:ribosomal protein S3